jgi:hypothetical protein
MPQLIAFSYSKGSDLVQIQAYVEDAVQVSPATELDPPQFASAACTAVIIWDEPIDAENAPTAEQIERMLAWITDWYVVPPLFDADE